ncbi:MAG: hypothetical protein IKH23_01015 [Clostridiales bacterium]|nr:hypothetical protein [Clostridiales bacterium]
MEKKDNTKFFSRHKEALASLFLCLVALIISLLLHPAYETNDDAIMEALLFGYQGNRTSFLVFINQVLSIVLYSLVSYFPRINWYFIMHWSVCLASLYVLARIFIRKFKTTGFFVSLLITAAALEALYMPQFTKTASLAVIAGAAGLLDSLREKRSKVFTVLCFWLILMGSMIRFESFLMVSPFIFCVGVLELVIMYKERREDLRKYVAALSITLVLVGSFYLAGTVINSKTPGSDEFYENNHYRSLLTDYEPDYSAIRDKRVLTEIAMLSDWLNNDPEVFTTERYKELTRDYYVKLGLFSADSVKSLFGNYLPITIQSEPMLMVYIVVTLTFLLFSKKRYMVIPLTGFYLLLELYLCSTGRSNVHRVNYGLLLALLVSLLYVSSYKLPEVSDDMKKLISKFIIPLMVVMGVAAICSFPLKMHLSDKEYCDDLKVLLADATKDKDCQYMVYTMALGVDKKRNIYDIPTDYNDGFFYMGGWQEGVSIPGIGYTNHCGIEGNPWVTCIDSENIRLVLPKGEDNAWLKDITGYIREHYGRNVKGISVYENEGLQVFRVVSAD